MTITRVARYDTGGSHHVQIDAGADGSLVALSSEAGAFLYRLEEDGSETMLAPNSHYGQFNYGYVETLTDGRYVLYSTFHYGLGLDSRVQIINRDGSPATEIVDPAFEDGGRQARAAFSLAPTLDGGFFYAWNDLSRGGDQFTLTFPADINGQTSGQVSAGDDVRVRWFNSAAVPTTPSTVADDDIETVNGATTSRRAGYQGINDTATLTGGQNVFVYEDTRFSGINGSGGYQLEMVLSMQISTPGSVGEPIQVDLGTFGEPFGAYPNSIDHGTGGNVVALRDGNFAVIWTEKVFVPAAVWGNYSFAGWKSLIRYFDAAGNALTGAIQIATRPTEHGNHSKYIWAEALADGRIAIAYNVGVGGVNGNGTLDAFLGVIGAMGSSIEVSRINPAATNTQFYTVQDLAVRADGTIDLVYNDIVADAQGNNVNRVVIDRFALGDPGELVLNGTTGNDVRAGGAGADVIFGLEGNDELSGGGGDDVLHGGADSDELDGGEGADRLVGGPGDDFYIGVDAADVIREDAGDGTDTVQTGLATYVLPENVENLTATDGGEHDYRGNAGNNTITGGNGRTLFRLQDGGDDTAIGGSARDLFFFGGALTADDTVTGGGGFDVVAVQGNYAALVLDGSLSGVEGISLQSGSITRWGQAGTTTYDYVVAADEALVAPGQQFRVNGQSLGEGEDLTFNGSAETDGGRFLIYAGYGTDDLTGGSGNDIFFFEAGRYGPNDQANGGGGRDAVVISGYGPDPMNPLQVTIEEGSLSGIEALSFSPRFATDPAARPSYDVVLENGNITPGETLIVNASALDAAQTLELDASAVADGKLEIYGGGGADTLLGGANADQISGGRGADVLRGNGGSDVFLYDEVLDSPTSAPDSIYLFESGADKIDLSGIDANVHAEGNQDFRFAADFTGGGEASAGEYRIRADLAAPGRWFVEGDTDGNGSADFTIALYETPLILAADIVP